jgi:hydroxymethylpyrimidine/phosphomethylpyrimidine kinase
MVSPELQNYYYYVTGAIAHCLPLGKGHGPTHHFYDLYAKAGF